MSPFEAVLDEQPTRPVVEPDLGTKIRYFIGWWIPEKYRGWVERDVASTAFPTRMFLTHVVSSFAGVALIDVYLERLTAWPLLLGSAIGALAGVVFFRDFKRRRAMEWHEKRWKRIRERDEGPDLRRFP